MELKKIYFYGINDNQNNPIDFITKKDLENNPEEQLKKYLKNAMTISQLKDWLQLHKNKFVYSYQLDEVENKEEILEILNELNIPIID